MPPTFFLVVGFILYFFLLGFTLVVCVPLQFVQSKKLIAQKAIGIVLISFPCLLIVIFILTLLLALPGALFLWILNSVNANEGRAFHILTAGILIFTLIAAISSLYFWYFSSRLIINYIDKRPLSEVYNNDKVYQYIRQLLIKFRVVKL